MACSVGWKVNDCVGSRGSCSATWRLKEGIYGVGIVFGGLEGGSDWSVLEFVPCDWETSYSVDRSAFLDCADVLLRLLFSSYQSLATLERCGSGFLSSD